MFTISNKQIDLVKKQIRRIPFIYNKDDGFINKKRTLNEIIKYLDLNLYLNNSLYEDNIIHNIKITILNEYVKELDKYYIQLYTFRLKYFEYFKIDDPNELILDENITIHDSYKTHEKINILKNNLQIDNNRNIQLSKGTILKSI